MTSNFRQRQNFLKVAPTCLGRTLKPKPKQQQTTSKPSKVYNPTKTFFFGTGGLCKKEKSMFQDRQTNWGLPTISQISLQPTMKVTTLWTTETGQVKQDSKQGSKAVRQSWAEAVTQPQHLVFGVHFQPTPRVGDASPKSKNLSGRENTGTSRKLDIGSGNSRSSHWLQIGLYRKPKTVPHAFVRGEC